MLRWGCVVVLAVEAHRQADTSNTTTGSFVWLSDSHLDLLYDHAEGQADYCRQAGFDWKTFAHTWEKHFKLPPLPQADNDANLTDPSPVLMNTNPWNLGQTLLAGYHGRFGCDTPVSLLWATYLSIRESLRKQSNDFVLMTGDVGGHYWLPETRLMRFLSLYTATKMLTKALDPDWKSPVFVANVTDQLYFLNQLKALPVPGDADDEDALGESERIPQIIACVGNNDLVADYRPRSNSTWNAAHFAIWKKLIVPESEEENFLRGQYYSVRVKKQPKLRVACLNSVWYSRQAVNTDNVAITADDPADQFAWLSKLLKTARKEGEKVIIAGHIPPVQALYRSALAGFNVDQQWHSQFVSRYSALLTEYGDVVAAQLYGHLHTDEFRVQYPRSDNATRTESSGLVLMSPSVCPNHGTNPSWRKAFYTLNGTSSFELLNYTQTYTSLYGREEGMLIDFGTFDQHKLPLFSQKYTSGKLFGKGPLTPTTMERALNRKLLDSEQDRRAFWDNELVNGGYPPSFLLRCVLEENWSVSNVRQCVQKVVSSDFVHSKENIALHVE